MKTPTQEKISNYLKVMESHGRTIEKTEPATFKNVLSVGDLKKILSNVDDNLPVMLEMFSDEMCSQESPLYAASVSETSTNDNKIKSEIFVLQTVNSLSYADWKKEGHGN